jgi:hypothetical protein
MCADWIKVIDIAIIGVITLRTLSGFIYIARYHPCVVSPVSRKRRCESDAGVVFLALSKRRSRSDAGIVFLASSKRRSRNDASVV